MKKKNNFLYSTTEFPEYTHRAIMEVHYNGGVEFRKIEVYTTNPSRNSVEEVFTSAAMKQNDSAFCQCVHWTTAEEDALNKGIIELIETL